MLSLLLVLRRSKNFTSSVAILMPPSVPLNHYLGSEDQQNRTKVLFHYSMQHYSGGDACFEHSNFFKVNVPTAGDTRRRAPPDDAAECPASQYHALWTARRGLRSNYELFNHNNFNIRYWSWNYRGCWHQTCPPIVPR